ncbi:MAG TPA: ComEC/Rec2 family competence protein [Chthoniobacterales bacterium]|nr:ComEC/Rec2 family competence protein [Chthoniobacterales bacterium]
METPVHRARQPFIGLGLAAVLGIIGADVSPQVGIGVGLLLLTAIVALSRRSSVATYCCAAATFFLLHSLRQTQSPSLRLARELGPEPQAIAVRGLVVSEPKTSARGTASFQFELTSLAQHGLTRPSGGTVLASWRGEARYGDELQLFGVVRPIEGPRNPGEFDMRAYLARHDVRHALFVRYPENGKIVHRGGGNRIMHAAQVSRGWMQAALARGLEDSPALNGLISGMVLGVRDDTPDEIEEQFQQTGTLHLFAASGLNVAMVAYLLGTIASATRLPRRWAITLIIPALFFYSAVTGLNTSSVRAALMAAFLLGGFLFEREMRAGNSIAAAAVLILCVDTNQFFGTGFQLSFAVVIAIIWLAEPLFQMLVRWCAPDPFLPLSLLNPAQQLWQSSWRLLSRGASVSLAAWVGSLPLILPSFYLITPVSLFANLVVVPIAFLVLAVGLMSLLVIPFAPWLAIIFNNANWSLAASILAAVELFTHAPAGHFYMELPHRPTGARVELTALDLGAGAALHLRTPQAEWLFDAGSARDFKRVLRGYLRSRGINRLDGLVLSHGDAAHIGGATALLRSFRPRELIDTAAPDRSSVHKELIAHLAAENFPRQLRAAPDEMQLAKDVRARILFPPAGFKASNADDQALVMQLNVANRWRILLMSDSGEATERALLATGEDLACDILIKGQHHSGVSGSAEFLECVQPRLLIASSPEFPENERVKDNWAQAVAARGIKLFRQDETGAVHLRFFRNRWEATPYLRGDVFRSPVSLRRLGDSSADVPVGR